MYDLKLQRIDPYSGSLCHQITDSETFNEYSQLRDPVERLKARALAEIVKSLDYYCFGSKFGILKLMLCLIDGSTVYINLFVYL